MASDFVFGHPIGALEPDNTADSDRGKKFMNAFKLAGKWISIRRAAGWLFWRYNWNKEYLGACTTVHGFIDQQAEQAIKDVETGCKTERTTIVQELAKIIRDPVKLRYQALGVFLPAMDATSIATGNVLFELARQPERWQHLRKIALSASEPLSFSELRSSKLEEIRHIILETVRHIRPTGRQWRTALSDTYLPHGGGPGQKYPIFLPKGTKMAAVAFSLHHDPSIWGDDYGEFKPERWQRKSFPSDSQFIPFSGGTRMCPASNQALLYVAYVLVKLLQRYRSIENHDPVNEFIEKWTITHESKNGVKIALIE